MSRLRFGPKITVVVVTMVVSLVVVGTIGLTGIRSLNKRTGVMYSNHAIDLQLLGEAIYHMGAARGAGLVQIIAAENGDQTELKGKFRTLSATVTADLEKIAGRAENQKLARQTLAQWKTFVAMWEKNQVKSGLTPQAAANRVAAGDRLLAVSNKARDGVVAMMEDTKIQSARAAKESDSTYHSRITLTLIILIGAIALGAAISVLLIRDIVPRVKNLAQRMTGMADGDFATRIEPTGRDEVTEAAQAFNEIIDKRGQFDMEVQQSVHAVATSTNEILSTAANQAASANEQAAAINETSSAVEEVRSAAAQAATKAGEVADRARVALEIGEQGSEAVHMIVDGMGEIRETVEAIAGDIQALSDQTEQIGEITAAVNDLADQSNLLALNATIEAARAGEQGKGFAVVADEVRNLAEQSKQATAQVETILADIRKATEAAVNGAQRGTEVVAEGTERAARAGEILHELGESTGQSAQAAEQIAASAREQNAGMDQIAQAMQDASQGTNEMADGARQTREVADGLARIANQLDELTRTTQHTQAGQAKIESGGDSTKERLGRALEAHGQWMLRLKRAIQTGDCDANPATVRRDDQCPFGKWLHHESTPAERSSAHYAAAKRLHAEFHQSAADVLGMALAGQTEAASEALTTGAFAQRSGELSKELHDWCAEV